VSVEGRTTLPSGRGAPRSVSPTLRELPLGAVRPAGWLDEQLRLQATGLTGTLEGIWPDVGPESAWLGGRGEDWERGPYYLDGLVPLAHLTGDGMLLAKASRWIEAILGSLRDDGSFGPSSNDDWWPRIVALKALTQHADATGDPRIQPFLAAYFRHQLAELPARPLRDWGRARAADNVVSVLWLYERTGEAWLATLARLLLDQAADWDSFLVEFPCTGITRTWDHMTHVVNVAMGLKTPAVRDLLDGASGRRGSTDTALTNLDRYHGQVHGMFSGDEWLAGPAATRGVELCAVVELMYSLERMLLAWGDRDHGDRLERLAYNLLPATMTADMTAHQYHQQANQVLVTIGRRDWTQAGDDCTIFGLEPNFGCCTANLHQGWPKFVRSMWLAADDGIAAVAHGPSTVRWSHEGHDIDIVAATGYPFDERITYTIRSATPVELTLRLRIPAWCSRPEVTVNGRSIEPPWVDGWVALRRAWSNDDEVTLRLPMTVRSIPRAGGSTGVALGPLVLAFSPGEVWERLPGSAAFGDWEVRPRRSWNIGLAVDPEDLAAVARVERLAIDSPPFGLRTTSPPFGVEGVAVKVWVPGRRLSDWHLEGNSAAPPPSARPEGPDIVTPVPLVPYGAARVRIAEFPTS
jgi:hypothetical protein